MPGDDLLGAVMALLGVAVSIIALLGLCVAGAAAFDRTGT
jgi:hypothetical protein